MKYDLKRRTELERKVIGTILIFSKKYELLDSTFKLDENDFRNALLKDVIITINKVLEEGQDADMSTVSFNFKKKYSVKEDGNPSYEIVQLSQIVSTSSNLKNDILILKQYVVIDKIETIFFRFERLNFDESDIFEYIEDLYTQLEEVKMEETMSVKSMKDNVNDTLNMIEANTKKFLSKGIIGVPLGFDKIDSFTGGFLGEELIIVGARPSMGKTVFMLNCASNASDRGYTPLIFSLETSRTSLTLKLIANRGNIDSKRLFLGKSSENDFNLINESIASLEETNMVIEDSTYHLDNIISKIRYYKAKKDIDIVFIDYLQLIRTKKSYSREQEVAHISRSLKLIAKELDLPIVCLAQLSRPAKNVAVKEPTLTDLRESGSIEQDADSVYFIHRPEYYETEEAKKNEYEEGFTRILLRKGRNVGTEAFKLIFDKSNSRFREPDFF